MIEVKNLVKRYGSFCAVDDLSFTVEKGEIVGLLGPNGAGKSTTMNMITGYISSTEGTVEIDGYDIFDDAEEAKQHIGYLPEQPPLYMDMKVCEYLEFVAELKKVKKSERAKMIEKIMEDTMLTDMKNRLIRHLSKGYKQRVGIAGALIGYPDVIILDEPTVGLDPKQIIEIRDLIKKLAKKHTVILSSHILSEVSAVCDRVIIINKGKLIVDDTPEKLAEHARFASGIKLVVKGDKGNIIGALSDVPSVVDVSVDKEENGFVFVTVCGKDKEEIREDVFFKLAEEKMPIYTMEKMTFTLEDIFLELTKEEEKEAV
ncbi:MAG: ABC transporter ATP-binding protein [bacterium]|nr:ABC transporter ATP-binding protein [bacterium]